MSEYIAFSLNQSRQKIMLANKYSITHPIQPNDFNDSISLQILHTPKSLTKREQSTTVFDNIQKMQREEITTSESKIKQFKYLFDQNLTKIEKKQSRIDPLIYLILLLIFYNAILIYIPLTLSLCYYDISLIFAIILSVVLLLFAIDIKKKQPQFYLKNIVQITLFLIIYFFQLNQVRWICFAIIIWLNFIEIVEVKQKLKFLSNYSSYISIFDHCFNIALLFHILACIWIDFIEKEIEIEINFLDKSIYLKSVLIVIQQLTNNSLFQPQTDDQFVILTIYQLLSYFLIAYILSNFSDYLTLSKCNQTLIEFINSYDVPRYLKIKLYNSFKIDGVSDKYFRKVNHIVRYNFIKTNFPHYSNDSLKQLITVSNEIRTHSNQIILQEGQIDDCSLYIVLKGTFFAETRNFQKVGEFKKGQSFGSLSFYTQQPRSLTIVSQGHGVLLQLSRQKSLSVLSYLDRQHFAMTTDQIIYKQKYPFKCFCCHLSNHSILQCPRLVYQPNKSRVIYQDLQTQTQDRCKVRRQNCGKSMKAWHFAKQVEFEVQDFLKLYSEGKYAESSLSSLPFEDSNKTVTDNYRDSYQNIPKFKSQQDPIRENSEFLQNLDSDQESLLESEDEAQSNNSMAIRLREQQASHEQQMSELDKQHPHFARSYDQQQLLIKLDHKQQKEEMRYDKRKNSDDRQKTRQRQVSQLSVISQQNSNFLKHQVESDMSIANKILTQNKIRSNQYIKHSNHSKIQQLSSFQPFQQFDNMFIGTFDFERMQDFSIFYPSENPKNVIQMLQNS